MFEVYLKWSCHESNHDHKIPWIGSWSCCKSNVKVDILNDQSLGTWCRARSFGSNHDKISCVLLKHLFVFIYLHIFLFSKYLIKIKFKLGLFFKVSISVLHHISSGMNKVWHFLVFEVMDNKWYESLNLVLRLFAYEGRLTSNTSFKKETFHKQNYPFNGESCNL